jgi:hypothetical protein
MRRDEFVKLAINNPKDAANILRCQAEEFERSKRITKIVEVISKTLFITDRTVYNDCKK